MPPPPHCVDCSKENRDNKENSKQRNEITFDSIYNYIESSFYDLKDKELALELQVSQPNHEMLAIWQYIKSLNKTIIVISDIYLPKDFIKQMLDKNGFSGYSNLYVSSDIGCTKSSGLLFDYVACNLKVKASQILHIGDNYEADIIQAKKHGLQTIFYQKIMERYLLAHKRDNIFYLNFPKDLGTSILLGLKALHWHKKVLNITQENYWDAIGYDYTGPIAYAYMYFVLLEAQRHKIEHLLFVARDGYTLQKVFDNMHTNIQTRYIYASRFFRILYKLDHKGEEHKAQAIIDYLASKYKNISDLKQNSNDSALNIIEKNKKAFQDVAKKEFMLYESYICKAIQSIGVNANATKSKQNNTTIGMVETVTIGFSAQNLLQEAAQTHNINIHAFYWLYGGYKYAPNELPPHSAFSPNIYLSSNAPQKWDFVEFLLTSPELPVKGIDSNYQPIYDQNPKKHELKRQSVYPHIANHALLFANDLQTIFGNTNVYFAPQLMTAYLDYFCQNPTKEDIEYMQHIFHDSDETHGTYTPLFTQKVKIKDFLKSYKKTKKRLLESQWITKKQYAMLAFFDIININMKGIKKLELCILPHTPTLFSISACLFGYCSLKFSIGRFHEK